MDVSAVKSQIKSGKLSPFYILTGDEVIVRDKYIQMMAESAKLSVEICDTMIEAYYKSKNKSLLQTTSLYLVRDDDEFRRSEGEKSWDVLSRPKNGTIVLVYSTIDKRTKFARHFSDDIVTFEHMSDRVLMKHIRKELPLSDDSCLELIHACESDYGRILLEIDKIKSFHSPESPDKVLRHFMDEGVIFRPHSDAVFDLVAAILDRDCRSALSLYEECKGIGEPSLVILSVLHTNARQLLQVQGCVRGNLDISSATGLSGFQIKCVRPYVGKYSNRELVRMLETIRRSETGIKTGEMPEDIAVDYVIVNCI